jgi:hypothetical protein
MLTVNGKYDEKNLSVKPLKETTNSSSDEFIKTIFNKIEKFESTFVNNKEMTVPSKINCPKEMADLERHLNLYVEKNQKVYFEWQSKFELF